METQGYIEYAISKIQANKLKSNNNVTAKEKKSGCPDQSTKPKYIKQKTRVSFKKTCSVYAPPGNIQKDNCMRQVSQRLWDSPLLQACFEAENTSNLAVKNLIF